MKDKINTNIELYLGNVTLSISVAKDLKREEGNLKNFGYIEVSSGAIDESTNCFWDNIVWFAHVKYKEFKRECEEELKEGGFEVKQTYRDVKRLLKRAFKLKIIDKDI